MSVYLLNTPILTAYGTYQFSGPLTPEMARSRLLRGYQSAVGHAAAAEFLGQLLGVDVPMNRMTVVMQPGDRALVLRLATRLPESRLLSVEEMAAVQYELGWLERLA